jgi:hypothetical protein
MGHSKSSRSPDGISPERIGIVELLALKHKSRKYYVNLPDQVINTFRLLTGDVLKIEIKAVFRQVFTHEEKEEEREF